MRKTGSILAGLLLIVPGLLSLLKNIGIVDVWKYFNIDIVSILVSYWPIVFVLIPGLILHIIFLPRGEENSAMLVPAGILTVSGIIMQISYSYGLWGKMWPGFILAIAVGLLEVIFFGNGSKGILLLASALLGLSTLFFSKTFFNLYNKEIIIPMFLIIMGLIIIFGSKSQKTI